MHGRLASPSPIAYCQHATLSGKSFCGSTAIRSDVGSCLRELAQAVFHILDWRGTGRLTCRTLHGFAALSGFRGGEAEWRQEFELLCKERGRSVHDGLDKFGFMQLVCDNSGEEFFAEERELQDIFNQLVQSIPEHSPRPNPALRSVLKKGLFRMLQAKNGKGRLGSMELRSFAELSGFVGTEEEWQVEFDLLCKGAGVTDGCLSQSVFLQLIDDTSEKGCYCSDAELLHMYRWYLHAGPEICHDYPEEAMITYDDRGAENIASPAAQRSVVGTAPTTPAIAQMQSSPPVSRETTFREVLELISKGVLDAQNVDFSRLWEVCGTEDLHRFAEILDESGWIKEGDESSDVDCKCDELPDKHDVQMTPPLLVDNNMRMDCMQLQTELAIECNKNALAKRECEEARAESTKMRLLMRTSIDEKSNALADAMICKLECEEAQVKVCKFRLLEGELADKLGKIKHREESNAINFQIECQALESKLREQTNCIRERARQYSVVEEAYKSDAMALQENIVQLELAFVDEYNARESEEMQQAMLRGTLVGMESEWFQVEGLLWAEVQQQEENSFNCLQELQVVKARYSEEEQEGHEMREQEQTEWEDAFAQRAAQFELGLNETHTNFEAYVSELRGELAQECAKSEQVTDYMVSIVNEEREKLQQLEDASAERFAHLEGVEVRCREEEQCIVGEEREKLYQLCREEEREKLQQLENISAQYFAHMEGIEAKCREEEQCIVAEEREKLYQLENTSVECFAHLAGAEIGCREEEQHIVTGEREKLHQLCREEEREKLQQLENISAQHFAHLEGVEARCREEEQCIVAEEREKLYQLENASAEYFARLAGVEIGCREEEQHIEEEQSTMVEEREKFRQLENTSAEYFARLQSVECRCREEEREKLQQLEKISAQHFAHLEGVEARCREEEQYTVVEEREKFQSRVTEVVTQLEALQREKTLFEDAFAQQQDAFAQRAAKFELGLDEAHANFEARVGEKEGELAQEQEAFEQASQAYVAEHALLYSRCLTLKQECEDVQHNSSQEALEYWRTECKLACLSDAWLEDEELNLQRVLRTQADESEAIKHAYSSQLALEQLRKESVLAARSTPWLQEEEQHLGRVLKAEAEESEAIEHAYSSREALEQLRKECELTGGSDHGSPEEQLFLQKTLKTEPEKSEAIHNSFLLREAFENLREECELPCNSNPWFQEEMLHLQRVLKSETEESEAMQIAYAMALPFAGMHTNPSHS